jgi:hypothetical protein
MNQHEPNDYIKMNNALVTGKEKRTMLTYMARR